MTFALPQLLWLLVLPAALLAWELVRGRRLAGISHPKILRAEAGLRTVSLAAAGDPALPAGRRRFLLCAGLALGVVALARPQWGRLDEPVFDQSREIIIALDLSRSMLTPDVKPSRLERSKLLIQVLLDKLRGERVGLVVFSGTAFLQSPVSADYEILREFLPGLGPDFLPEGGTNYAQLLDVATEGFGDNAAADRYLIILSDGEATDENWKDRIPQLAKKNIRVIGLGVGTAAGGMIPDGSGGFMKDETGAVVMSKLEAGTLRELAAATHGVYRDASEWVDLAQVLDSTVEAGRKGRFVETKSVRYVERYQWALAQALACLLASFWLEFPVRPKSRAIRLSAPAVPARAAAATLAALLVLLFLPGALHAVGEPPAPDPAANLSKIVGRLAGQASQSALDWAELGRETVTWGQHLKSASQEVPPGPVRDALRAVDLGSTADPKASDWPRLKSELEDLLKKPDDQKDQKQKQNQDQSKDQDQDKKPDEKKDQSQKPPDQKDRPDQPKPGSQGQPGKPDQPKDSPQPEKAGDRKPEPRDSALGDMKAPTPAPTPGHREPSGATQKVGGAKKQDDPASHDPELAVPLERLEQLKNEDSPTEIFQMLHKNDPLPTPPPNGKNW
jgi:Ca-activated chloride channel family protein